MKTKMQDTSLTAYVHLQPNIGAAQAAVYAEFQTHSDLNRLNHEWAIGLTNREAAFLLGWDINRVTGRCKELRDVGLVEKHETRLCRVTGQKAIAWKVKETKK